MNHKHNKGGIEMENILIGLMVAMSFAIGLAAGGVMMIASVDNVKTYKETQNAVVFNKQYLLDKNMVKYNEKTGRLEVPCQN